MHVYQQVDGLSKPEINFYSLFEANIAAHHRYSIYRLERKTTKKLVQQLLTSNWWYFRRNSHLKKCYSFHFFFFENTNDQSYLIIDTSFDWSSSVEAIAIYNIYVIYVVLYIVYHYETMLFNMVAGIYTL